MKNLVLLLSILLCSGCASAVMKSGCGHINGSHVTIPYVGGTADGNAYGCYMACAGQRCSSPSYADLATITAEYIKDASKDNAMQTTSAGTIVFTPAK